MIFRQLFEAESSSWTYLLGDEGSGRCVLIDPVIDTAERDLEVIRSMGLTLSHTVETHIHADHLTGARKLKQETGCLIAGPAMDELPCTDIGLREGVPFTVGAITLHPLYTPGHTSTHHAYLMENCMQQVLFSGDALLIEACGRTDFQSGDPHQLYRSIREKFFTLPDETLVYPAHDYQNRRVTTIGQEKIRNPRLGNGRSEEEFVSIMNGLNLPYPQKIDFAVPGNERCGECPDNVPEEFRAPCVPGDQG